ncbi:DUF262 domain-containing protein [Sporosarcina sp. ANT_H38]|uniref:DUF262 domain-containing protein n=1 Tax=Sporosarcina sp. ANT_H38 TaxID=2597358 RepID=UPI00165D322E|nr:DUF262 domain-containing protein [Sporosarcina sp. ANT_H38]
MVHSLYEVDSVSYLNYSQGRDIRLPRFQRKDVWNYEKQFALLISLFKGYPIGVVVLNEEKALHKRKGLITTSWLLDGRQRRTTLVNAYNNPEVIYEWGKKFIKFSNNSQPEEVRDLFWRKLENYLEQGEENVQLVEDNNFENNNDDLVDIEFDGDMLEELDDAEFDEYIVDENGNISAEEALLNLSFRQDIGLNMLLEIILMCHKKTKNGTGYIKPFNYSSYFKSVSFIESDESVNPEKLSKFIRNFIDALRDREFGMEDFIKFCEEELIILPEKKDAFARKVSYDWKKINQTINSIWDLTSRFEHGKMPLIRLNNVKSSDAQNIFKFINSQGTPLSAVEILSAKPSWNRNIKVVTKDLEKAINALYSVLDVKTEGVVKWDIAATFIDRLSGLDFIFKPLNYSISADFKTKITLGFKLLAGIFEEGINKEDLSNLSKNKDIDWDNIDLLIADMNEMGKTLLKSPFFKTLRSWNNTLMGITSEALALNFAILMYHEWHDSKEKGMYSEGGFIKKAISLFDKSIYQYVTRKWRGSSDSKIANNVNNFNTQTSFIPIDQEEWIELIEELVNKDKIDGVIPNAGETKAVLYHYYMLSTNSGPGFEIKSEVDHIIPQDLFKKGLGIDPSLNKDNLANLCLLESEINNSKRKKTLAFLISTIDTDNSSKYIMQQICTSVELNIEDLKGIDTPTDLTKLKKLRIQLMKNAFSNLRTQYLQR